MALECFWRAEAQCAKAGRARQPSLCELVSRPAVIGNGRGPLHAAALKALPFESLFEQPASGTVGLTTELGHEIDLDDLSRRVGSSWRMTWQFRAAREDRNGFRAVV